MMKLVNINRSFPVPFYGCFLPEAQEIYIWIVHEFSAKARTMKVLFIQFSKVIISTFYDVRKEATTMISLQCHHGLRIVEVLG